jgi:hypothetical protein
MKLKNLLKIFLATVITLTTFSLQAQIKCLQEFDIRVLNGGAEVYSCVGDGIPDEVEMRSSSYATPIGWLIVDDQDIIVKYSLRAKFRTDDLPTGAYRIFGFSFLGTPSLQVGIPLAEASLANICYELSDNFIGLFNVDPDGQAVATAEGMSSLFVCSQDGNPDIVRFQTTSPDPNYAYLITDENNIIEAVVESDSFDFEGQPLGTSRVWGLSYVGDLVAQIGDPISGSTLSSACFDLSDTFIEVIKTEPEGGEVQLSNGLTSTVVCTGDNQGDFLTFTATGSSNAPYLFVLTDSLNRILFVLNGNTINFDFLATGVCRIWGVSFTGNFDATIGQDILSAQLSDDCFDVSDQYVEVFKKNPSGGMVAFASGANNGLFCVNDGTPDQVTLSNNGGVNEAYTYILTDTNDVIIQTFEGDQVDLEGLPGGLFRIYGLAFTGVYLGEEGDELFSAILSDECFELSENFIPIENISLEPGIITLESGAQDTSLCFGDNQADQLSFLVNEASEEGDYRYLVTDGDNNILAILEEPTYDFAGTTADQCRIWGLAFTGDLLVAVGDQADAVALSSECFKLTANFIQVQHLYVEGGTVSLTDGTDTATVCVQDGVSDLFALQSQNAITDNYAFVFATEEGIITQVVEADNYDFDNDEAGNVLIYGLSYVGDLLAQAGDHIFEVALASQCFDLSDNSLRFTRKSLQAGAVSLASGTQDTILCFGDPQPDQLRFSNNGFNGTGAFRYVLTDRQDIILDIFEGPDYSFTDIDIDFCKVYGVSFTGNFNLQLGDELTNSVVSDECYDITEDFVSIRHLFVEGGTVELSANSAGPLVCASDGIPDIVTFGTTSTADANYRFILTDGNDNILIILEGNSINLDIANAGICRIYGVSYIDELNATTGMNINDAALASSCFDLSDNFIELIKRDLIAGQVRLEGGSTSTEICAGDNYSTTLTFTNDSPQDDPYVYLVTDENNNILEISSAPSITFDNVDIPVCRVYGAIYTGELLLQVGDNALSTAVSTQCFEVSGNFVTITHKIVEGGNVSLSDGRLFTNICVRDGNPDLIELATDSESEEKYAYLLTNDRNQLLNVLNSNEIDLDGSVGGTIRIYGFSYTGDITVGFNQDVTSAVLSDDCYDLSDNAVTINRIDLEAGSVSLINGQPRLSVCFGDEGQDRIRMRNTAPRGTRYVYVVTDEQGEILQYSTSPSIILEYRPVDRARIYGVAYTGNPLPDAQGNLFETVLATECYEVSENFVEVTYTLIDGGQVSTAQGDTEIRICTNDGTADVVEFQAATEATGPYAFILTDASDNIIFRLEGNSLNLDVLSAGTCKVWGVSYRDALDVNIGDNLFSTPLANECYDISDDAVVIIKDEVVGGTVRFADGSVEQFTCPENPSPKLLSFDNTGSSTGSYAYLITNENNELLAIAGEEGFDFDNVADGVARVWGVAYVDSLIVETGMDVTTAVLADRCESLSSNFVEVFKISPEAGSIATASGETNFNICIGDGVPSMVRLDSLNTFEGAYTYVLTDEEGQFIQEIDGDAIDFDLLPAGSYQIFGIAYTGNLIAINGTIVTEENLSDDCFDVSENSITVISDSPNVGALQTEDKETLVYVCPDDNNPNIIQFFAEDVSLNPVIYVLTDENNTVLEVLGGNQYDFENELPVVTKVWAVSYTGTSLIETGTNLDSDALSTECAELSDNAVTIVRDAPQAGILGTESGPMTFQVCANDGNPDSIRFTTTEESASPYLLVLTDENNLITDTTSQLDIDFELRGAGTTRVWGLSYTGKLQFNIGDDVQRTILADDCFELTETFVEVRQSEVDGGLISTVFGSDSIYVCPDDVEDIISFSNNSAAVGANYRYALTRTNGLILAYLDGNSRDFNNTAIRELRVYGISFTGEFMDNAGRGRIDEVMHSDSCYILSENFITVFLDVPDGGTISTVDEQTSVQVCASPSNPGVEMMVDNNSAAGYAYILTREDGEIVLISRSSSIDMTNVERGNYLMYGLSYTGMITAQPGDNINDGALSNSCHDLSTNVVEVERLGNVDGGAITLIDGTTTLFSCPGDGLPDLAVIESTSTLQDANYVYVITREDNRIFIPNAGGNIIDFNGAPAGIYRIYAVSFTGDFTPIPNRDITTTELSGECWELSSNYITIYNEGAIGGTVSSLDDETEVNLTLDEAMADGLDVKQEGGIGNMYAYVLTDQNNVILDATFEDNVELSMLDTGEYRIYGAALNGNYTGMTGADVLFAQLSDECFAVSDNFIALTITAESGELREDARTQVDGKLAELSLWPNPVNNELTYELKAPAAGEVNVMVFNTFGQQVLVQQQLVEQNSLQAQLNVHNLENGIYLLVVTQNGRLIAKERFVKQE